MRRLLTEFYGLSYSITSTKRLSYILGTIYVAILFYVFANGFVVLAQGWLSMLGKANLLFNFPVNAGTMLLFIGLTYKITPELDTIKKDAKKNSSYVALAVCTLTAIVLWLYIMYSEILFV